MIINNAEMNLQSSQSILEKSRAISDMGTLNKDELGYNTNHLEIK